MDQFPKTVVTIRQSKRKHKFILVIVRIATVISNIILHLELFVAHLAEMNWTGV